MVEDNADSAELLQILLRSDGHDVRIASNGDEAISQAVQFLPEVMLIDIGLPGMNGYEVAGRIRSIPGLSKVRLIALTGYGQEDDLQQSQYAGFHRHLTKPADIDLLREEVTK